ncbi:MAG: DUF3489 domain-containing protein [Alphaproteobacteria bacterium]|nr:MAG: DUF3489 domain-containing protein [Alphaproteobacteria bacterium]
MTTESRTSCDAATPAKVAKLDLLIALLQRPEGADMSAMSEATGWLPHSIRGAMAGALKKKGHGVSSEKLDGRRVWRITTASVA